MAIKTSMLIRWLRELSCQDISVAGAKAANLGELTQAGFPVPNGFVLTTQAFESFLAANRLDGDSSAEIIARAVIPQEITTVLYQSRSQLGNGDTLLAVRSSGVAEDLADASFAGQYETVLNVRSKEELVSAVRHCWASAFSQRVAVYKKEKVQGQPGDGTMALLVQEMVNADAAGVAFTANPVTGDLTETVVNAVRGLGERLVSGQASPDEWLVKDQQAIPRSNPEKAIDSSQVVNISNLAKRVEQHFGSPQDIEWAISGGKLFLLQARPITSLPNHAVEPVPVPVIVPAGFWERESAHFPQPLSPMMRTAYLPAHIAGLENMCRELYMPFEKFDFKEIGGWLYQRMVPPGGKDRKPPPDWLMYLLLRLVPSMRAMTKGLAQLLRTDISSIYIDKWYNEWKPGQKRRITELGNVELSNLSNEDLDQHLQNVLTLLADGLKIHGLVTAIEFSNALLAFSCRDLFGWDEKQTLRLLSGLSTTTSEASIRLAELSQRVANTPELKMLFETSSENILKRMTDIAPDFARGFAAYQRDFGYRAIDFEVAVPTVFEKPSLTITLIQNQTRKHFDPKADASALERERTTALTEANEILANRPPADRARFEQDLKRAQRGYPVREDHEFYLGQAPLALLRYAALEMGKRLAKRGQISVPDDIFWLEVSEARDALRKGGDLRELVQKRQGERAWVEAHPGPASYGKNPGPPPSLAPFPAGARTLMTGVLWLMDRLFAAEQSARKQENSNNIRGIAASPGKYTGTARVILNEHQFSKLQPGDVLVCLTTSPAWSILFSSVGALVTNAGGILSHPAIIAREYRVPAVVATGNATDLLHDGQIVTVDGAAGTVQIQP